MTTAEQTETLVVRYNITDAAIALMAKAYMPLVIAGIEDREGYRKVHEARMVVKAKRVEVEKTRKALKEDALRYGRTVDSEAKRITALLEPIERHLEGQEKAIDDEKQRRIDEARMKAEAEARAKAEAEEAQRRAEREAEEARLKAIRDAEEARLREEAARLAAERRAIEEARKAEQERIDAERRALEAAQKAERDKLDAEHRAVEAERKRIADLEAARLRAIEEERIRKEAAEKAQRETEERIAREAAQAKARAEAEESERKRQEAMRPDIDKVAGFAAMLAGLELPHLSNEAAAWRLRIRGAINAAVLEIQAIAKEMQNGGAE